MQSKLGSSDFDSADMARLVGAPAVGPCVSVDTCMCVCARVCVYACASRTTPMILGFHNGIIEIMIGGQLHQPLIYIVRKVVSFNLLEHLDKRLNSTEEMLLEV